MGHAEEVKAHREEREKHDPCIKESAMSMKCLADNFYDKSKCEQYFENKRLCKTFWYGIKKERVLKGIKPDMPLPEERAAIKKNYQESRTLPTYPSS